MTSKAHLFQPGRSGNPAGKAKGTRNLATRKALAILEEGGDEVIKAVVEAAKAGDMSAAKIVVDRLVPPARERHVELPDFPDTSTVAGLNQAQQLILAAVANAELTPSEASILSGIAENRRKSMETAELAERIGQLERSVKK